MLRDEFHTLFRCQGPVIMPVIHALDTEQCLRNVQLATQEGVHGVFLINHDFHHSQLLPILEQVRSHYPDLWLGVNFLGQTGEVAFPLLGRLAEKGCLIDAYWADDACIDEHCTLEQQTVARRIAAARSTAAWQGFYLGGTCFKKQRYVKPEHHATAAELATHFMDAVCTSGTATGKEVAFEKMQTFRRAVGNHTLALASGITPDNAPAYLSADCFLVSTGINIDSDFYNIDAAKLRRLMSITTMSGDST